MRTIERDRWMLVRNAKTAMVADYIDEADELADLAEEYADFGALDRDAVRAWAENLPLGVVVDFPFMEATSIARCVAYVPALQPQES